MHHCPTCGTPVENGHPLLVDRSTNTVARGEAAVKLRCPGATGVVDIIEKLNEVYPATASHEEIQEALWGDAPPPNARSGLRVRMSYARTVLKGIGVGISVVYGRGYRLAVGADGGHLQR